MPLEFGINSDYRKVSRNLYWFFFFYLLWSLVVSFSLGDQNSLLYRFDFVFVFFSVFFLFKELLSTALSNSRYYKYQKRFYEYNRIPISYKIIMGLLLIWVLINVFRTPPVNPKGFIRFLFGQYYVAAWYPLLFFYLGSKIRYWKQIWRIAILLLKFFVFASPLIFFNFFTIDNFYWTPLVNLVYFIPLLLINWNLLKKQERLFVIVGLISALCITFLGGSRGFTLRFLFYLPVLYILLIIKKQKNRAWHILSWSIILLGTVFMVHFVYNNGVSNTFSDPNIQAQISKFESEGFENTREAYVYPDFFADMNTIEDWIYGRGLNGSYYSDIFVGHMETKGLEEDNSLGVKLGYRTELECGYLQTILKIGLIGLILKILLALSAIFLGLFRSKNWFVKGCSFIIIEWLIFMYPAALPEFCVPYMLFWLCIGICLSRETRQISSSMEFIRNDLNNFNKQLYYLPKD